MRLSDGHFVWTDVCQFTEIMSAKDWRKFVIEHGNKHFVRGELRIFRARSIGGGAVEVYKVPLKGN